MDEALIHTFAGLLDEQASGEPSAIDRLFGLNVSIDSGSCLFTLYEQWAAAFSYSPGRIEAIQPIRGLAHKLQSFSRDDTVALYDQPEWRQLVALRGPVEVVQIRSCPDCRIEYASMGTSGFYDANGLVCPACGNVYFKSYYDESETPRCSCGGEYPPRDKFGCPSCGNTDGQLVRQMSPFEYFATHTYTRGSGA